MAKSRIRVSQSDVDKLNQRGMERNLKRYAAGKGTKEVREATRRFYPSQTKSIESKKSLPDRPSNQSSRSESKGPGIKPGRSRVRVVEPSKEALKRKRERMSQEKEKFKSPEISGNDKNAEDFKKRGYAKSAFGKGVAEARSSSARELDPNAAQMRAKARAYNESRKAPEAPSNETSEQRAAKERVRQIRDNPRNYNSEKVLNAMNVRKKLAEAKSSQSLLNQAKKKSRGFSR